MHRQRILIAMAAAFLGSIWLTGASLLRLFACLSGNQWPGVVKFSLMATAGVAGAVLATAVFVRTFRSEVVEREAIREKYRDRDAPPWAQQ
jgi:hypothetical protein